MKNKFSIGDEVSVIGKQIRSGYIHGRVITVNDDPPAEMVYAVQFGRAASDVGWWQEGDLIPYISPDTIFKEIINE